MITTIRGQRFDITNLLCRHPGGSAVLLASVGKDGTRDFDSAGHPESTWQKLVEFHSVEPETGVETSAASPAAGEQSPAAAHQPLIVTVRGKRFDVTNLVDKHPGGRQAILDNVGKDGTRDFDAASHSPATWDEMLKTYSAEPAEPLTSHDAEPLSARLAPLSFRGEGMQLPLSARREGEPLTARGEPLTSRGEPLTARSILVPAAKPEELPAAQKLVAVRKVSPTCSIFTFKPLSKSDRLVIPPGKHVRILHYARDVVQRPYTPIANDDGGLELLVKVYRPVGDKPGGRVSQYIHDLRKGLAVNISRPVGRFDFDAFFGPKTPFSDIAMFAMGTGVSAMYQLLQHRFSTEKTSPRPTLYYLDVNPSLEEVLLQKELQDYADNHDDFHCTRSITPKLSEPPPFPVLFGARPDADMFRRVYPDSVRRELPGHRYPGRSAFLLCGIQAVVESFFVDTILVPMGFVPYNAETDTPDKKVYFVF